MECRLFRVAFSRTPLILCLLVAIACDETPAGTNQGTCDADAVPILLKSKADDDDGDGIILDEDFPTINDEDDDIADHAWVRDDTGVYHLFFQNEGQGGPSDIEHYLTTDFRSLHYVGVALRAQPGGWDADGVWAPHIVRSGGTYFMFYTGLEGTGAGGKQRIGVATSTDLMTWSRAPVNRCPGTSGAGCVYECRESWTAWDGPAGADNQRRDSFVLWDSEHGRWVMFVTARSTNQFGVVVVAYATDLTRWVGAGYIDATRRLASGVAGQTTGGQAENPFVMSNDGINYLLFTDWQDLEDSVSVVAPRTMVQYATSSGLTADSLGSADWFYRGYTPDPGVNAIEVQRLDTGWDGIWLMSQSISNKYSGYSKAYRRQLRLKCVTFGDGLTFDTSNARFPGRAPINARARGGR